MARAKEPKGSRKKKFSARELRFVNNMILGMNQAEAARSAGFSERSARQIASRLMTRDDIHKEIRRGIEKSFEREIMGPKEAMGHLSRMARTDLADLTNEDGTVRNIRDIPERTRRYIVAMEAEGRRRKYKLEPKQSALSLIGKYHRIFVDRLEIKDTSLADRMRRAEERARDRKK